MIIFFKLGNFVESFFEGGHMVRVLFVSRLRLSASVVRFLKEIHGDAIIVDRDSVVRKEGVNSILRLFREKKYFDLVTDLTSKELTQMCSQGVFPLVPRFRTVPRGEADFIASDGSPKKLTSLKRIKGVSKSGFLIF